MKYSYTELYQKWHNYVRKILIDLHILFKIKRKYHGMCLFTSLLTGWGVASRRRDLWLQGRDKTALSYHTAMLQLTWYKYIDFVFISRVERWKTVKGGEKDNDGVILLIDLLSLCPEEKKMQFDVKLGYWVWRAAYFALYEIIKISSLNHKIQGCIYLVLNFANFNERDGINLENRKVYYIQPVNQNIT